MQSFAQQKKEKTKMNEKRKSNQPIFTTICKWISCIYLLSCENDPRNRKSTYLALPSKKCREIHENLLSGLYNQVECTKRFVKKVDKFNFPDFHNVQYQLSPIPIYIRMSYFWALW
jgi:hypothetical protein